jgi:hypothetical protein
MAILGNVGFGLAPIPLVAVRPFRGMGRKRKSKTNDAKACHFPVFVKNHLGV